MPKKFPKPFFRSARNCWFVQIGKEQIKLHEDEVEALRLYHELMTDRAKEKPKISGPSVAEILDNQLVGHLPRAWP